MLAKYNLELGMVLSRDNWPESSIKCVEQLCRELDTRDSVQ